MEITVKVEPMDRNETPIKVGDKVTAGDSDVRVIESFDLSVCCVTDISQSYEACIDYVNFEDGGSNYIDYVKKVEPPQEERLTAILSDPDLVQALEQALDLLRNERQGA